LCHLDIVSRCDRQTDAFAIAKTGLLRSMGGAENDGHENDGPSKCPGMKLTDVKLTDMKITDMKMQDMFQVSE